jgi:hypothetical protein
MRSWVVALSLLPCLAFAGPSDKKPSAEEMMANGEKDFSDAEALRNSGDIKTAKEKFDSALFFFSAAHDLAPEATGPLLGMGISLGALGRCEEAVPKLNEYLDKKAADPNNAANPAAALAKEKCLVALGKVSVVSFKTKPLATDILLRQGTSTISLGPSPTVTKVVASGKYEVVFLQADKEPITRNLTLENGDDEQLNVNLKRKRLTRLSWDPGLLGMPRAFWWTTTGLILGAGAATATFLFVVPPTQQK